MFKKLKILVPHKLLLAILDELNESELKPFRALVPVLAAQTSGGPKTVRGKRGVVFQLHEVTLETMDWARVVDALLRTDEPDAERYAEIWFRLIAATGDIPKINTQVELEMEAAKRASSDILFKPKKKNDLNGW